jgi:hypothetical protein
MGNAGYGNHTEGYGDPKQQDSNTDDLPSNATQPGGQPKGTEEKGSRKAGAPEPSEGLPSAGPHADPNLTNKIATPGAGTLPEPGDPDGTDATSG